MVSTIAGHSEQPITSFSCARIVDASKKKDHHHSAEHKMPRAAIGRHRTGFWCDFTTQLVSLKVRPACLNGEDVN
jgi:hypothetical protein